MKMVVTMSELALYSKPTDGDQGGGKVGQCGVVPVQLLVVETRDHHHCQYQQKKYLLQGA